MKRLIAVGAAVGVLGAGAVAANATTTISFISVTKSEKETRNGYMAKDEVRQNGKKIGTDTLTCKFAKNRAQCRVVVKLAKGSITATFTGSAQGTGGPLKIVAGTGAYAGATGTGSYKNLNKQGTRTRVTLRLA